MTINYCPKCGSSISEGSVYCPYCGYKLSLPQKTSSTFAYPQPPTAPMNIAYVRGDTVIFPKLASYLPTVSEKIRITLIREGFEITHSSLQKIVAQRDLTEVTINIKPVRDDLKVHVNVGMSAMTIVFMIIGFIFFIVLGFVVLIIAIMEMNKDKDNIINRLQEIYLEIMQTIPSPSKVYTMPAPNQVPVVAPSRTYIPRETKVPPLESGQDITSFNTVANENCPFLGSEKDIPKCTAANILLPYIEAEQICRNKSVWPTCPYYKTHITKIR